MVISQVDCKENLRISGRWSPDKLIGDMKFKDVRVLYTLLATDGERFVFSTYVKSFWKTDTFYCDLFAKHLSLKVEKTCLVYSNMWYLYNPGTGYHSIRKFAFS